MIASIVILIQSAFCQTFTDTVSLSYGTFDAYKMEPLEMAEAVDACLYLNRYGRLPRFNNQHDYETIGSLYSQYGIVVTWVKSRYYKLNLITV